MLKSSFLAIFLLIALTQQISMTPKIPKLVWTYLPDTESISTLQRLCIDNLKYYSELSGYTFKAVTKENYTLFFKDWHEITSIVELSQIDHELTIASLIKLKIL